MAFDPARVKSLFLAASDLPSPEERAAYLDRECGSEPDLRARVEALLTVEERAGPRRGGPRGNPGSRGRNRSGVAGFRT